MAIILSGNISSKSVKTQPQQRVSMPVVRPAAVQSSDDHTLIVNGQKKSIGKKSQYLLDMLTLDDE